MLQVYKFISSGLIIFSSIFIFPEVCVWRDPERTINKLFPDGKDYKSIEVKIVPEKLRKIEKLLGKTLDPGEKDLWIYYEITDKSGEILGYVLTDAETGQYGVIEIVMGITPNLTIKNVYIQRSREKDKKHKSQEFLNQFVGKSKDDKFVSGEDTGEGENIAVNAVIYGIKKMLTMYDILVVQKDEDKISQITLQELLENPTIYKNKIVIIEGIFAGICCATDFFLKDGNNKVEVYIQDKVPMPPKSKVGSRIKVTGKVKVKRRGKEVKIIAERIEFSEVKE